MIEVKGLSHAYHSVAALDSISFHIKKNEIVGLLGPNGAGKSTIMNLLTGYIPPPVGTVFISGHDMGLEPAEARRHIGYLPEIPPVYPDLTVEEQLRFCAELRGLPAGEIPGEIERCEKLAGVYDVRTRLIRNLSKGYRQRVGFAQALIGDPEIVILDEPMVGLDPVQIIEMRNLIAALRGGHTVILSSHILSEISMVCSRVLLISRGKLLADDTPAGLTRRLSGGTVLEVQIAAARDRVEPLLRSVGGVTDVTFFPVDDDTLSHALITAKQDRDVRRELFSVLAEARCPLLLLRPAESSLEDAFLRLVSPSQKKGGAR